MMMMLGFNNSTNMKNLVSSLAGLLLLNLAPPTVCGALTNLRSSHVVKKEAEKEAEPVKVLLLTEALW
jgi:hypothetical protein